MRAAAVSRLQNPGAWILEFYSARRRVILAPNKWMLHVMSLWTPPPMMLSRCKQLEVSAAEV